MRDIILGMMGGKPATKEESMRVAFAHLLREPISKRMMLQSLLRCQVSEFHTRARLARFSSNAATSDVDRKAMGAVSATWENAANLLNHALNRVG